MDYYRNMKAHPKKGQKLQENEENRDWRTESCSESSRKRNMHKALPFILALHECHVHPITLRRGLKTQPEKILDIHQTSVLYFSWHPSTKSQWTTHNWPKAAVQQGLQWRWNLRWLGVQWKVLHARWPEWPQTHGSDLRLDSRRRKTSVQPEPHQSCWTRRHPTPSPERACQRSCPNPDKDLPVIVADRWGAERLERGPCDGLERGPCDTGVQERWTLQPCQLQAHLPHQCPLHATGAYPCELHHATPQVKRRPAPPTVQFSKEQIVWDSAAQIYQSSLRSNGENYHNRGHHNRLLQSFRLSQPQPPGAQAWLLWHLRKYKHLDYQLPEWMETSSGGWWCQIWLHQCKIGCPPGISAETLPVPGIHQWPAWQSLVPFQIFVDDTILYRFINWALQEDLRKLEHWKTKWEMSFHPDKCHWLPITRCKKTSSQQVSYTLHGQILETVPSAKVNRMLGFLRRNLKVCSVKIKELAYKAQGTDLTHPWVRMCSVGPP